MRQAIVDLYDAYTHSALGRREFLQRLAGLAGGTAAAQALLPLLENNYARAAAVRPDHRELVALRVDYPGGSGRLHGYLAHRRDRPGPLPTVLVIHENRGLNPHIEDVTRRLALAGFLALAPDLLSPGGGTPADEDRARAMVRALDEVAVLADLKASVAWLAAREEGNGRVGCVGFCWGGGNANRLATVTPSLAAAVVYYGRVPPANTVPRIEAPLLLHFAGLDARINAGIEGYEQALRDAGKAYTLHRYAGANHAFNNDTNAARYDPDAAALAWERTLRFLDAHLRT
jgi:carboxymethylenebutenolidase